MDIKRSGEMGSLPGPEAYFTGRVRQDGRHEPQPGSALSAVTVTFEPGARTAWHTHPIGQHLIVTFGEGWVQREGGPKEVIRPGDTVWIPGGVRHWHGATATKAMTHVAIQEAVDGVAVHWEEKVSDAAYLG